jgi:hypothetical protein
MLRAHRGRDRVCGGERRLKRFLTLSVILMAAIFYRNPYYRHKGLEVRDLYGLAIFGELLFDDDDVRARLC